MIYKEKLNDLSSLNQDFCPKLIKTENCDF